jgi:hypothetical protein
LPRANAIFDQFAHTLIHECHLESSTTSLRSGMTDSG